MRFLKWSLAAIVLSLVSMTALASETTEVAINDATADTDVYSVAGQSTLSSFLVQVSCTNAACGTFYIYARTGSTEPWELEATVTGAQAVTSTDAFGKTVGSKIKTVPYAVNQIRIVYDYATAGTGRVRVQKWAGTWAATP